MAARKLALSWARCRQIFGPVCNEWDNFTVYLIPRFASSITLAASAFVTNPGPVG